MSKPWQRQWRRKKSGANKFEITIPRERLLTDEEMKEERREQKIRR